MPSGDYQTTLDYLYAVLPMYQRVGAKAYKKDIDNTVRLCAALGDPHLRFRSIHVAGTNGKGSTSHMLASILQESGYKTGLYTSPHLKDFRERIRINGVPVDEAFVVDFVKSIKPQIAAIQPSFFEITVAMAFSYFASEAVDVAVIEVGLGGRLDSTNIITPELSVITNIAFDHMDLLGSTLPEIAAEKAGIIKRGVPVVISETQEEVSPVFERKASVENSHIVFADKVYNVVREDDNQFLIRREGVEWMRVRPNLQGVYQQKNIGGVLMAIEELIKKGFLIPRECAVDGINHTVENTGLKGRWQVLSNSPAVVCDTAHNEAGVREVMKQLANYHFRQLYMVWGMVGDKDPDAVLALLPQAAYYVFCQARIPRAMDAHELALKAASFGLRGEVIRDVNEARRKAVSLAGQDDFIYIGGSTFVVAELEDL